MLVRFLVLYELPLDGSVVIVNFQVHLLDHLLHYTEFETQGKQHASAFFKVTEFLFFESEELSHISVEKHHVFGIKQLVRLLSVCCYDK